MKNKRMFVVKYLSSTTHKGTRFKITDFCFSGISRIFPWDSNCGFLTIQAKKELEKMGIEINGFSEPWGEDDKVYLFSDDFSTPLRSE
jgi:hypothetical protein